jgi:hypothetical protein
VKADLKLADVQVADYAGFILPCMASGNFYDNPMISAESVALVKNIVVLLWIIFKEIAGGIFFCARPHCRKKGLLYCVLLCTM